LDKPIPNVGFKRTALAPTINKSVFTYSERLIKKGIVVSLQTRLLALGIFSYFFIENGTLGLFPQSLYIIYRNVRLSDFVLYALVIYSLFYIREYRDFFKSRSFLVAKLVLAYLLFEFVISYVRYKFNVLEYFFRLKGVWASFLVFPFLLLLKRNGLPFLIKTILPVAIVSNILYILSALTGTPFLPDISIIVQPLPGDLEVFRVYGGTFYGEMFFLGFVYLWITKKFQLYQLSLVILFAIPHILAFGRTAWAYLLFTILVMIIIHSLRKHEFKIFLRQGVILCLLLAGLVFAFIKFIPESNFYLEAVNARIFEGQQDIKYSEGTYGNRVNLQNNSLVNLWLNDDIILGVGMHPMWVIRAETHEEQVYYNSFSDVSWASVLAAYGLLGFALAVAFQLYYIRASFKLIRRYRHVDLLSFILVLFFAKLTFDTFVVFSYTLTSINLWGLFNPLNFFTAAFVCAYEKFKRETTDLNKDISLERGSIKTNGNR
jgi:hypothetical protein